MPSFDNIPVEAQASVDFEAYCTCGKGICHLVTTRSSRQRNYPQIEVDPCPDCIDKTAEPLRERIQELEQLLEEARQANETA
jgi:hypothetical protein